MTARIHKFPRPTVSQRVMFGDHADDVARATEAPFVHVDEPDAMIGFEIDAEAIKRDLFRAVLVAAGWFCGGVLIAVIEAFRRGIW